MKYCLKYNKDSEYMNDVDEIIYFVKEFNEELKKFITSYENKRVILDLTYLNLEDKDIKSFIFAFGSYKNVVFRLSSYDVAYDTNNDSNLLMDDLYEQNIKFFVDEIITDYDTLNFYCRKGVSDVYIGGSLAFDVANVRKQIGDNVQIRMFPNLAYSDSYIRIPADMTLYTSFVRPEDTEVYEHEGVNVFEFVGRDEQQDTYYKIYAIDKKWYGNLQEMIAKLEIELDSRFIFPAFGDKRVKCNRKCQKGGGCNLCPQILKLSSALKDKNIIFEKIN